MAYETEDHETLYCFPAFNSSCVKEKRSTHDYYIMYVFFSLLSAWTVFLNLLVIISISHFKKLHTPTNLLILSLAVSDLLVGLVVMPIEAMKLIETCWYFGDTFCKMFLTIMGQLLSTSLSNLVLIAIDRYVAVCHPLLYPQKITTNRTLCSIGLCWFSSSAYNIALICISLNQGAEDSMCNGECVVLPSLESRIIDLVISFVLPCTLIITLYLKIFCVAQRQVKVINSMKEAGKHITEGSGKRKSENKAAVTLGIVVAIHLLCWIPYYIMSLLENTAYFPIWVLYINSCLNPVVYAFFYPWFRKSVMHILTFRIVWTVSSQLNVSS